jgi:molecular chaperone DnaJ
MQVTDYYQILGVDKSASNDHIKSAYKKLARKYHPDLNPGDRSAEEKFKEISAAYAILSDPDRRKRYDTLGTGFEGGDTHGGSQGYDFTGFDFTNFTDIDFKDIFDDIFKTKKRSQRPGRQKGTDIQYNISISLIDAVKGLSTQIILNREKTCNKCNGSGRISGMSPKPCSQCSGKGRVKYAKSFINYETICDHCQGSGLEPGSECSACKGRGLISVKEKISVKIPPGVDTGSKIRVSGKGNGGINGGDNGDLYILTAVLDHAFFNRKGHNIYATLPVRIDEVALGAKIDIPTVDGTATRIRIPPGTNSGQVFRLKGKGMPSLRGSARGDMLVTVEIKLPKVLDENSKALLREFAKLNKENPRDNIHL